MNIDVRNQSYCLQTQLSLILCYIGILLSVLTFRYSKKWQWSQTCPLGMNKRGYELEITGKS